MYDTIFTKNNIHNISHKSRYTQYRNVIKDLSKNNNIITTYH